MQHKEYDAEIRKKQFDLEKDGKDTQKVRLELEAEMRNMDTTFTKASADHYQNTMYLKKDDRNEQELARRHV